MSKEKERTKKKTQPRAVRPAKKSATPKSANASPKPRRPAAPHRVAAKPAPKRRTAKGKPRLDTRAAVERRREATAPAPATPAAVPEPERTNRPAAPAAAAAHTRGAAPLQASEPPPAPLLQPAAEAPAEAVETTALSQAPAPALTPEPLPRVADPGPADHPLPVPAASDQAERQTAAETEAAAASDDEGMAPEEDEEEAERPHLGRNGAVIPFRRPMPAASGGAEEQFHEGDHVVYPTHGVGKVERIATEDIAGHRLELIHITFEENRMTLRVPVAKAHSAGLRKLASRALFDEALAVLKGRARIKRTMWSRRAQEYEAKINSGDPLAIAEVVRDLHRNAGQPDQSFSERQIYEAAMDRLAAELAALDQTDKPTAATKLADYLKTTEAAAKSS
ncbi:MAG: CarD family transcriptional regulator [Alphaproteobacteria bacterium]|nr:CarD family transcriptional regulator [Alphaproteobacteria bacterium]